MKLNINTDAAVRFTNELEKMHKKHLPSAVRGALNDAVYDVKTNTMPKTADKTFTNRQPNFFKANSRFENAKGFDLKSMKATVGFVEGGLKGGNNYSVKDLEQQEDGGVINRKSFIPLIAARVGNSPNKPVRANARLSAINKIIDVRNITAKTKQGRFVKAVVQAGKGGFVLSGKTLWKIDSFKKVKGKTVYKKTALYTFRKGRKVSVGSTNFMKKSSIESAKNLDDYYIKQAKRQIEIAATKFK